MSLTVYVYCNGIEQGDIEVIHNETIESLRDKITDKFGINDFIYKEGFDVSTMCQDDSIYIEYDKVKEAELIVNRYMKKTSLTELMYDPIFMQALIESNKINDTKDKYEYTVLHIASIKGFNDEVQTLIDAGADVNVKDEGDRTPHYHASSHGHNDVLQTLIKAGADVNIKSIDDDTSIHVASYEGHNDVVCTLIDAGADVNIKNSDGYTSLHLASMNGHNDVVCTLIDAGAYVNIKNNDGYTSMHMAALYNNNDIVQTLLKAGADVGHYSDNSMYICVAPRYGHKAGMRVISMTADNDSS